jgi:general stress protein 26
MKAMLKPREHEGLKVFYFTTNTSALRVRQYRRNPKASIYFYERKVFRGVMLKGTMEILQDQASKDRIWREGDEAYYPHGVTDPDYCVLRFTAKAGRMYENFQSHDFVV